MAGPSFHFFAEDNRFLQMATRQGVGPRAYSELSESYCPGMRPFVNERRVPAQTADCKMMSGGLGVQLSANRSSQQMARVTRVDRKVMRNDHRQYETRSA